MRLFYVPRISLENCKLGTIHKSTRIGYTSLNRRNRWPVKMEKLFSMLKMWRFVMDEEQNMPLDQVRKAKLLEEEMGFDVPFATFTWKYWLDLQARMNQGYSRYLRAIENRRTDQALLVTLEMMEMAADLLKEAVSCADPPSSRSPLR